MQLKVCESDGGIIKIVGRKNFTPVVRQASKWVREEVDKLKTFDAPQTTNGIVIVDNANSMIGSLTQNAIGFFHNNANSPYYNAQFIGLYTTAFSCGHGLSIIPENLMKVCALFTARKTITNTWVNHYDEYSAPNIEHTEYPQWNNDAVVYALFNSKSNQSSLRNVQYKGKTYQIKNEFFFMPRNEIKDLADKNRYKNMFDDVKFELSDRYVYTLLSTLHLSDDAKYILDCAKMLIKETMPMREEYSKEHPELCLDSWDAGYLQLKNLWKDIKPDEFKKFRESYLVFEKRMRLGVYKFGFLEPYLITDYDDGNMDGELLHDYKCDL